jgi:hypothetical protein
MSVTAYLERARQCAEMAEQATSAEDRQKLLKNGEAWTDLARETAATEYAKPDGKPN